MQTVATDPVVRKLAGYRPRTRIDQITDGRYTVRLVENSSELESVLRLRFDVFKKELAGETRESGIDFDSYDLTCEHILVYETESGRAVGTYRLNTLETAGSPSGFYASGEFGIEELSNDFLSGAVELGRACIESDHRNSRVLFMLWKGLAAYLTKTNKRYLFGCCSIFTQSGDVAGRVLSQLKRDGHMHDSLEVVPRKDKVCIPVPFENTSEEDFDLPALVKIYLRIGAKVCGEPAIDREFKTIDFFVVFDVETITPKYLKMFFGDLQAD